MTTETQAQRPVLRPLSQLEKASKSQFINLFEIFYLSLGKPTKPPEGQAGIYWEKLHEVPYYIIQEMFDDYLNETPDQLRLGQARNCPTVGDMVARCRRIATDYSHRQQEQQSKEPIGDPIPADQKIKIRGILAGPQIFVGNNNITQGTAREHIDQFTRTIEAIWAGNESDADKTTATINHVRETAKRYGARRLLNWPTYLAEKKKRFSGKVQKSWTPLGDVVKSITDRREVPAGREI